MMLHRTVSNNFARSLRPQGNRNDEDVVDVADGRQTKGKQQTKRRFSHWLIELSWDLRRRPASARVRDCSCCTRLLLAFGRRRRRRCRCRRRRRRSQTLLILFSVLPAASNRTVFLRPFVGHNLESRSSSSHSSQSQFGRSACCVLRRRPRLVLSL